MTYELRKVAGARPWQIVDGNGWRTFAFVEADFNAARATLDRLNAAPTELEAELLEAMVSDAG